MRRALLSKHVLVHGLDDSEAAIELAPTHRIQFPGEELHSVSFSPDGKTAYCQVGGEGIDLWAAAWSVWPEALGSITLLLVLGWFVCVRRVRSRPQMRGTLYCQSCNYNVVEQVPDAAGMKKRFVRATPGIVCPECGTDLAVRPARRGRSAARRLWLVTLVVACVTLVFGLMMSTGVRRNGRGSVWLNVWSTWVDEQVERHQVSWLIKHRTNVQRVCRVDTATGEVLGRLCTRRGYGSPAIRTSPDGDHVVFQEDHCTIAWVSTHTGWVQTVVLVTEPRMSISEVVGFGGQRTDPWVYYGAVLHDSQRSRLMRWRPSTDERVIVVDEPAKVSPPRANLPSFAIARQYALLQGARGVTTVSASAEADAFELTIRAPEEHGGQLLHTGIIPEMYFAMDRAAIAPDGLAIYVFNSRKGLIRIDAVTGKQTVDRPPPSLRDQWGYPHLVLSADGRRLFVTSSRDAILVHEIGERGWFAQLTFPAATMQPNLIASPDGRWLGVLLPSVQSGKRPAFRRELLLYDLRPLDKPTGRAGSSGS